MGLQKKLEKWVAALEIDRGPAFWSRADAAPLKEFFSKLLAAEVVRSAPDLAVKDPIPFEKVGTSELRSFPFSCCPSHSTSWACTPAWSAPTWRAARPDSSWACSAPPSSSSPP